MNIRQRILKLDNTDLLKYLDGARSRVLNTNRMVASAAAHSVRMIEAELQKRGVIPSDQEVEEEV